MALLKVGLIDNDLVVRDNHNFPNLAIMKISNYHKQNGDSVELIGFNEINPNSLFPNSFDLVYISKAFTDSETPEFIYKLNNVKYGGTGFYFDKAEPLPDKIEHTKPDYEIYDKILHTIKKKIYYTNYSIGYTTRGCFRHCQFCVNRRLNKVELHSPIDEFYNPNKKKLAMLDDNVLGLPNRELYKIFDKLGEIGKPFQYRQGMDIRLLTKERIKRLFELRHDNGYYFAFDKWSNKDEIIPKMKLWHDMYLELKYNNARQLQTRIYLLTGFNEQNKYDETFWLDDLETLFKRIEICFEWKLLPFVMRFETVGKSPLRKIYQNICQWTNHPSQIITKTSFREFLEDGSFSTKETKMFFDKHKEFWKYLNLKL